MRMIGRRDAILPLADHARHDVTGRRVVAHVLQGVDVAFGVLGQLLGGIGIRVVQVTVEAGTGRAALHAGGQLVLGGEMPTQRALLGALLGRVPRAHAIGAGHHAVLAADALLLVHQHDVVAVAVAGARGAHRHARGVLALLAHGRQRVAGHVGVLPHRAHGEHLRPALAQGNAVFHLAGHLAPEASGAAVQVHNNAITRHSQTHPRSCRWERASRAGTARA